MAFVSRLIDQRQAKEVRRELGEDIILKYLRNLNPEIKESKSTVADTKKEASEKHRSLKDKVQGEITNIATIVSLLLSGILFAVAFNIYAFIFAREEAERQELLELFAYEEDSQDSIETEYRKSWNRMLKNAFSLGVLYFVTILRQSFPSFYEVSMDCTEHVFNEKLESRKQIVDRTWEYIQG